MKRRHRPARRESWYARERRLEREWEMSIAIEIAERLRSAPQWMTDAAALADLEDELLGVPAVRSVPRQLAKLFSGEQLTVILADWVRLRWENDYVSAAPGPDWDPED